MVACTWVKLLLKPTKKPLHAVFLLRQTVLFQLNWILTMLLIRRHSGRHQPQKRRLVINLMALSVLSQASLPGAQTLGISALGTTGGLVIPYADVLSQGSLALTTGNYQEAQLGAPYVTQQNTSFGVGLLPGVEFFGRFGEYTNPNPNSIFVNGIRDISANLKVQLPSFGTWVPKIAVGMNDINGGAVFFKSSYLVASEQYGPFQVALGYAKGQTRTAGARPTFDGVFRGVNVKLTDNGLAALAEFEGPQKHVGLRWTTGPLAPLANSQLIGQVQRSYGDYAGFGLSAPVNRFGVSLVMPFGENDRSLAKFKPDAKQALPALDETLVQMQQSGMQPTAHDRLDVLKKALVDVGLERVRVGLHGPVLVVEYENHRYAHNEVDALGLVFGLAAELAPKEAKRINAVTFKEGLRLYETGVGLDVYRAFLRDGEAKPVNDTLSWERVPTDMAASTDWVDASASRASSVRLELKPDLNYTLGTEIGALDYALAANLQAMLPLWKGARLYSSSLLPMSNTANMDQGGVLSVYRQREGLNTLALQQSFWLGSQILSNVSVGKFHNDTLGVQWESALFVPGTDDVIQLKGARYDAVPGGLAGLDRAATASYRHLFSPAMSIELGANRYTDGTTGPSVKWNQWFGDMSVQLFYRRGGSTQFAGLQLSFPFTPRRGMEPGPVVFSGASQYAQSIRTKLTTTASPANFVLPGAVHELKLATSLDDYQLNAGRNNRSYFATQLHRMRESFFSHARDSMHK